MNIRQLAKRLMVHNETSYTHARDDVVSAINQQAKEYEKKEADKELYKLGLIPQQL